MKRQTAVNIAVGIPMVAIAVGLVATMLFSRAALQPHHALTTTASTTSTSSPSPSSTTTTTVVASPSPSSTPPIVATITNPLPAALAPSPSPSSAPAPAAPASPPPSPSPSPSPVPSPTVAPSPAASPTPPPAPTPPAPTPTPVSVAPCSWSIDVSTLSDQATGTWSNLGTWTGSAVSATSPIFVMAGTGWLRYVYGFSSACSGHAVLASYNAFNGSPIYTTSITTTVQQTQEANLAPNTQVAFKVTLS